MKEGLINKWQWIGFIAVCIAGSILHFTYKWSGENFFVGLFAPVNESTWEHLKLLITPIILFAVAEYLLFGKNVSNFIPVKAVTMLLGMATIVTVFYTYTGVIGENFVLADIATFILGVWVAYYFSKKLLGTSSLSEKGDVGIGIITIITVVFAMVAFTMCPPPIALFAIP